MRLKTAIYPVVAIGALWGGIKLANLANIKTPPLSQGEKIQPPVPPVPPPATTTKPKPKVPLAVALVGFLWGPGGLIILLKTIHE